MTEHIADTFEVSPQQEQLLLSEPDGPSGRIQATLSLEGPLDVPALEAALRRTVERHEILRTTFLQQSGIRVPVQAVGDELAPTWSTFDLSPADPVEQAKRLQELSANEIGHPLDYESGPLLRALLVRLADGRHALVITVSSLCADASSLTLLARELSSHYGGAAGVVEDPL